MRARVRYGLDVHGWMCTQVGPRAHALSECYAMCEVAAWWKEDDDAHGYQCYVGTLIDQFGTADVGGGVMHGLCVTAMHTKVVVVRVWLRSC